VTRARADQSSLASQHASYINQSSTKPTLLSLFQALLSSYETFNESRDSEVVLLPMVYSKEMELGVVKFNTSLEFEKPRPICDIPNQGHPHNIASWRKHLNGPWRSQFFKTFNPVLSISMTYSCCVTLDSALYTSNLPLQAHFIILPCQMNYFEQNRPFITGFLPIQPSAMPS
jgi:hypothetical protein